MQTYLITIMGPDQPGLVKYLSQALQQHQGTWLCSQLQSGDGLFYGYVKVQLPTEQWPAFNQVCVALEDFQIQSRALSAAPSTELASVHFQITANDRTGIIEEVTTVLHQQHLNVQSLNTSHQLAPNWGTPLFQAKIVAQGSAEQLDATQEAMEALADD